MSGNLPAALANGRRRGDPMREHDRLPEPVRHWAMQAALPWSPRSLRKLWARALAESGGCEAAAIARLSRAEARQLDRADPRT
ncbi:DUF6525 family protein [Allosediminivita pacifica]|uniref:Uncharacterized protein n=1 Tax=Allosediminivita pacifica TaxID=1267769 RepID=A0A2T6B5H1_9RHOB|nr:DUF6525 family protein [Allosediminivita pacifica]PTX51319.1 hypothetical protein C8N44_10362 [Allosediminivita pacifica]GGA98852.1 hypothetical protein GCM10011324_06370 [Allosediminivita pacifica]